MGLLAPWLVCWAMLCSSKAVRTYIDVAGYNELGASDMQCGVLPYNKWFRSWVLPYEGLHDASTAGRRSVMPPSQTLE